MKSLQYIPLLFIGLISSCKKDPEIVEKSGSALSQVANTSAPPLTEVSTFMMIKVGYFSKKISGISEINLKTKCRIKDSIPLSVDYAPPNDIGHINLSFKPTDDSLFSGTLLWMGTGSISFPAISDTSSGNLLPTSIVNLNDTANFQKVVFPNGIENFSAPDKPLMLTLISRLKKYEVYKKAGKRIVYFHYRPSTTFPSPDEQWIFFMFK